LRGVRAGPSVGSTSYAVEKVAVVGSGGTC
jgi:hypothetical protein